MSLRSKLQNVIDDASYENNVGFYDSSNNIPNVVAFSLVCHFFSFVFYSFHMFRDFYLRKKCNRLSPKIIHKLLFCY